MAQTSKIAFVFPGQGSQYVGMGKALCEQYPVAKQVFLEADDVLGFALSRLCFVGPEAELQLTANTQPAILTVSVAALRVLEAETPLRADFVAGHSLGEYSALVCAGALTFADAVRIVRERGCLMQDAVPPEVGAMAAILGLEPQVVRALCEEASDGEVVTPANYNGGGQVVIAGSKAAVLRAIALAKERGAKRALTLRVSAPFHCPLMEPAATGLIKVLTGIRVNSLSLGVVANVDAQVNYDAARIKSLLVEQAVKPVRWEESVYRLRDLGCDHILEVGPGKVLTGLTERISPHLSADHFDAPPDLARVMGRWLGVG